MGFLRENSRFSLLDSATSEWGRGGLWREGVAWPNRTSRAANKIQSRFIFSSKSILYFHYTLIHITYLSKHTGSIWIQRVLIHGEIEIFKFSFRNYLGFELCTAKNWNLGTKLISRGLFSKSIDVLLDIRLMTSILASEVDFHHIQIV